MSIFAHEVGNQMNDLSLEAQMLERGLRGSDESLLRRAQAVRAEVQKLSSLLNEFRALDQRRLRVVEPVDVAEMLRELLGAELLAGPASGIAVRHEVADDVPLVAADRDDVWQILLHIVQNAIEASPEGGALTVQVGRDEETVVVTVQDNGPGIPEGIDVFRPRQTTKDGHCGIGLSISRYLVKSLGGTIRYDSTTGVGTTFTIVLPVAHGG